MTVYMEEALLFLILAVEIWRLAAVYAPKSRKNHFRQRLQAVEQNIWDLEFKRFKMKEVREEIRRAYSDLKSKLFKVEQEGKNWPADGAEEERRRREDQKTILERDIGRYEAQMKEIDEEIGGAKPTIDSLQEVKGMLRSWMRKQ